MRTAFKHTARAARNLHRVFMGTVVLAMALVGIVGLEGTASAGTPVGTGSVLCFIGGSVSFNPPLTPGSGTANVSMEILTVNLSGSGCSGKSTNTPQPNPTSATIVTKQVKVKAVKIGVTKYAGGCSSFISSAASIEVKSSLTWGGGSAVKGTKTLLSGLTPAIGPPGETGFQASGTSTKSYAGPASAGIFFDGSSTSAIETCISGSGPPISTLSFDPNFSFISLGGFKVPTQPGFAVGSGNGDDWFVVVPQSSLGITPTGSVSTTCTVPGTGSGIGDSGANSAQLFSNGTGVTASIDYWGINWDPGTGDVHFGPFAAQCAGKTVSYTGDSNYQGFSQTIP